MSRLLTSNTRRLFSTHPTPNNPPTKNTLISRIPVIGSKLHEYFIQRDFKFDEGLGLYPPEQHPGQFQIKEEVLRHAQNEFIGGLTHSMGQDAAARVMKRIRLAVVLVLISAGALWYFNPNRQTVIERVHSRRLSKAKKALLETMSDEPSAPEPGYISRSNDEEAIREWITHNSWSIIVGSKGIGKSTLAAEIVRQLKLEGYPVLLIRIAPEDPLKSFSDQLHIPIQHGGPSADSWRPPPSLPLAVEVLRELSTLTDERPIVVIDQINHLQSIPEAMDILRGVGEEATNLKCLPRLVYVTSDNDQFGYLIRADSYFVDEMSEEEARAYLTQKRILPRSKCIELRDTSRDGTIRVSVSVISLSIQSPEMNPELVS